MVTEPLGDFCLYSRDQILHCPMSDAHSGMQAHVALSICGQVSHKAYAAGLFTSAWPRSKYRKDDIRAAALLAVLKV